MDLIIWPDKGYKMHEDFRKELLKFWRVNNNFDKLVTYGISRVHKRKQFKQFWDLLVCVNKRVFFCIHID